MNNSANTINFGKEYFDGYVESYANDLSDTKQILIDYLLPETFLF